MYSPFFFWLTLLYTYSFRHCIASLYPRDITSLQLFGTYSEIKAVKIRLAVINKSVVMFTLQPMNQNGIVVFLCFGILVCNVSANGLLASDFLTLSNRYELLFYLLYGNYGLTIISATR